jgi:VIT1/CCC1 family predicted Fe2+/Mn2+ transporter
MNVENLSVGTKNRYAKYLRNVIFGFEDGLVSSVGVLSGIAVVGTSVETIILAGVVLIFVEAFSMGVGSLLSENAAKEFREGREVSIKHSIVPSSIMFSSYFLAGFITLAPYIFFNVKIAFYISIIFAMFALFILGAISAHLTGRKKFRHGMEMFIIGGAAIGLGVLVGTIVNSL